MNEMELQTTLDPIEMDMGDPEIVYSPVLPNPEGEPTYDLTKVQIQGDIYKVKDSEVHEWARTENKPTYTKAEVGLGNVDNTSDLDKPISTATQNALDGKVDNSEIGNYYTKSEVNSALDNKADKSDTYTKTETDNLLSEKADSSSVYTKTETDTALDNKVDKVSGKGLSTNDYDDTAKGIVEGVTSALDNKVDKDGDKVLSDNNYSDTDKTKLDGIEANANHTEVDTEISSTSENPLQNKAIYDLLNDLLPEAEETGNPISISNASGFNAKALTVDMLPIQAGSGTPSPDNVRPISGRTSLDVTVNGETETLNFGQTVYGGTSDVVNGGTSDEWEVVDLGTLTWSMSEYGGLTQFASAGISSLIKITISTNNEPFNGKCSIYETTDRNSIYNGTKDNAISINVGGVLWISDQRFTDATQFKNSLSGVMLCYEKATPTTISTPAVTIPLEKGNNTLSTSGDNMDLKYSTTISNPTPSLSMARPSLGMVAPTIDSTEDTRLLDNANIDVVEEPTEENDER